MIKSRAELQFTTVVYAILALVVLIVIIGVFYLLIKGPLAGLLGIGQQAGDQGDTVMVTLKNIFGGCKYGEDKEWCSFGKRVECDSKGVWVTKGDCTEAE